MNLKSFTKLRYDTKKEIWNLFIPNLYSQKSSDFYTYTVQQCEEMRIDLVVLSMYQDNDTALDYIDVILRLNDIDNPLNIVEGMILYYPPDISLLESYIIPEQEGETIGRDITRILSVPNKSTRIDSNRKNYLLPPTVSNETRAAVRIENGKIMIGGIN